MDFVHTITNQNTKCIICRNYKCARKRTLADGRISWLCTSKNCNGQIKTDSAVSLILEETGHNQDEMSRRYVQSVTMKGNCKINGGRDMNSRPSEIIHEELVSIKNVTGMNITESVVSSDLVHIRLAMYREKRKHLPTIPKNVAEVLRKSVLPSVRLWP